MDGHMLFLCMSRDFAFDSHFKDLGEQSESQLSFSLYERFGQLSYCM